MDAKDLLLADLEHFGMSMLQNEQVGEKRFEFFVTLATAVAAGLIALATSDNPRAQRYFEATAIAAIAGLLVVGLLTYVRLLHRNRVTDEYQRTLKYIRRLYAQHSPLAAEGYKVPRSGHAKAHRWLTGGYAETVGAIDGLLCGGLVALVIRSWWPGAAAWLPGLVGAAVGFAVAGALWTVACRRDKSGGSPASYFRAGVGIVVVDEHDRVLVLERSDVPGAWQFPQGGIEDNEEPADAALRELREETGLTERDVTALARYPEPLAYVLPPQARTGRTGVGQVQWWFLFRSRGAVVEPPAGEFLRAEWRSFDDAVSGAAPFRRAVYERLRDFAQTLATNGQR